MIETVAGFVFTCVVVMFILRVGFDVIVCLLTKEDNFNDYD